MGTLKSTLLTFLLIPVLTGCGGLKQWQHLPETKLDEKRFYIVSHEWHTGIIIPGNDLGDTLLFLKSEFGHSPYYEFGWGDRAFYQAKKVTAKIAVRSILLPTGSVMHVVAVPQHPYSYFAGSRIIEIKTSGKGYDRLVEKIAASFKKDRNNDVIKIQKGIYGRSLFFEGVGKYHLANTCNTWTAMILKSAGVPVRTFFTLTADSIMDQSQKAMARYRCCP